MSADAAQVEIGGKVIRMGGIAKGSGMIHPTMATMLAVVTCDATVEPQLWRALFKRSAIKSFNQVRDDAVGGGRGGSETRVYVSGLRA